MGAFCAATGYTPTEFWEITHEEFNYIAEELRKQNG
jgi:hypothetical protein